MLIVVYQSINKSIFECIMPHVGYKLAQSSTIHKQTTHSHKTVDLDDVSFTYTVYKSVKGPSGYREFSLVLHAKTHLPHGVDSAAVLWLWQARHRSLVYIQYKFKY